MKEFFIALMTRLMTQVPELMTAAAYNNQDGDSGRHSEQALPAVLVEIPNVDWLPGGNGFEEGVATVSVRLLTRVAASDWLVRTTPGGDILPAPGREASLEWFDLCVKIDGALQAWGGPNWTPMMRTKQVVDAGADDMRVDVMEYVCEVRENNLPQPATVAVAAELEVDAELATDGLPEGPAAPGEKVYDWGLGGE